MQRGTKAEALRHGRVPLTLHLLRPGEGGPLLCLHALRGSASDWAEAAAAWPGPVYALDFAGHGASGWIAGGGYTPELLAGDADVALARLGTAWLVGAGLGAYVALLLAGARPEHVPGALLLPGDGLGGGGGEPDPAREPSLEWARLRGEPPPPGERPAFDPFTAQLEREFRPPDYAAAFAARASRLLLLEDGEPRPPWWQAAAHAASAERVEAPSAAAALARLAPAGEASR
jgi:pimeloyl-ACP methyl ester carboxylesterase